MEYCKSLFVPHQRTPCVSVPVTLSYYSGKVASWGRGDPTVQSERSAETEIPQQRRCEVLQQSVKQLIIRPVARVMSGVNGTRLSAAEDISLRNKKTKSESIKHINTVTHFCKPSSFNIASIAEQG